MSTWNKYNENLIKKWSSMAKTYSTMHSISSEYYNNWDKRLGIPVVLLGAISASSIFTTSSESNNIWAYINGALVLTMTGISGINKFLGTHEKQIKHTSASFKYTQISMNIDTLLSFPRKDREEQPKDFIKDIKLAILEVREHSPYLPTWVVSNYIRKLDKSITNTHTKVNRHEETQERISNKIRDWNTRKNSVESQPSTISSESNVDKTNKHTVVYHKNTRRSKSLSPSRSRTLSHIVSSDNIVIHIPDSYQKPRQKKYPILLPNKIDISTHNNDLHADFNDEMTEKVMCISDKLKHCDSQSETEEE